MNNSEKQPYKAFIVPHTHWDREWYFTFQKFRVQLLETVDNLLEILEENSEYSDFNFDGQTIVLEDYLEVKPENRDILKNYISENRIQIGPWYILPDEFLVSGESLIRNLLLGHRLADDFGRVMKIGYLPDPFGHIAQMPQILEGFDIDNIIFWRGIDYDKSQGNEFIWQGADGTELFAAHLPPVGYCNAKNLPEDRQAACDRVQAALDELLTWESSKSFLLMNGVDHLQAQPHIPELVADLDQMFEEFEIRQGSLRDYLDYARETVDRDQLSRLSGEFRSGKDMMILNSVYSARMYLKQANEHSQQLLEKWAEPTATWAWLEGQDYRQNLLWTAWKWLLKNQPHDSICGCSIDQVHREMMTRYSWSQQISEEIIEENLEYLASCIEIDMLGEDELALTVFNPLPYTVDEPLATRVKFPEDTELNRVRLLNETGEQLPVQLFDYGKDRRMITDPFETPQFERVNYADISFVARGIPACGYKTYIIKAISDRRMPPEFKTDISSGTKYVENKYYRITATDRGTVTIYDKINDKTLTDCHQFVDGGDAGDEYTYSPPVEDKLIYPGLEQVSIEEEGPQQITLKIAGVLKLPKQLNEDRKGRSEKTINCPVSSYITLYTDHRRIDFKTVFNNRARDHRLRVLFPTGLETDFVYAGGHFNVVHREIGVPDSEGWVEKAYKTAHNEGFVDVNDGDYGLALLNRGLPEYEVIPGDTGNMIALTLLRSVGWLSVSELEYRAREAGPCLATPEAQCLGENSFEYALVPHQGNWEEAGILRLAQQYRSGIKSRQLGPQEGSLPAHHSYFKLHNQYLELSAIKKHEETDKLLIRIYNPTDSEQREILSFPPHTEKLYIGDLDESYDCQQYLEGEPELTWGPKEIKTLIFE